MYCVENCGFFGTVILIELYVVTIDMKYFNPQDHYFREAKKHGYKARSAFKLEEIDQKYRIFDAKVKTVLDIGCAP